jgi:hypothetical protein
MYICANAPIVTAVIAHAITVNVALPLPTLIPIVGVAAVAVAVLLLIATKRSGINRVDEG